MHQALRLGEAANPVLQRHASSQPSQASKGTSMTDNFWEKYDKLIRREEKLASLTNWYKTRPMFWYYVIGTTAGIVFGYQLNSLT